MTLEIVHEEILSPKRELSGIVSNFEEDKMKLSSEIKKQIEYSRKTPILDMLTKEQIEKQFL